MAASPEAGGGCNFGPASEDARPVRWITERLTERWPGWLRWDLDPGPHAHEADFLSLDSAKATELLGWKPVWDLDRTLEPIVEWYVALCDEAALRTCTLAQIERFAAEGAAR